MIREILPFFVALTFGWCIKLILSQKKLKKRVEALEQQLGIESGSEHNDDQGTRHIETPCD
jgi:hypothetical protein